MAHKLKWMGLKSLLFSIMPIEWNGADRTKSSFGGAQSMKIAERIKKLWKPPWKPWRIEFHGSTAVPYSYIEGKDNFEIDNELLEKKITPKTRWLILNDLQNPTGAECSLKELEKMPEIVRKNDLLVLCDEAYFGIDTPAIKKGLEKFKAFIES